MACLQYQPSPITLESGLLYTRQELFEMQQDYLMRLKEGWQKYQKYVIPHPGPSETKDGDPKNKVSKV
jgi:hypothetical protein